MLQAPKRETLSHLRPLKGKPWILNAELQDLVSALLDSSLALPQSFFTMSPFLSFRMEIYILCHYMLKVYNFILKGGRHS